MTERIDGIFYKRVALYLLALSAALLAAPAVLLIPLADDRIWREFLYSVPASFGFCFTLSWAIAYHRQFEYPEAFAILKTGAAWGAVLLGPALAFAAVPKYHAEVSAAQNEILFLTIVLMAFGTLGGPLSVAFWLIVLRRAWPRK